MSSIRDVELQIAQFKGEIDPLRQARIANIEKLTAATNMGERIKAMMDLIAIAFWRDTTKVASLMMSHTESRSIYDFIGVNEELHYLSHFVTLRREIFLLSEDIISRLRVTGVWGHSPRSNSEQPGQDDNEPMVPAWLGSRKEKVLPNFEKVNQWHTAPFAYFLDKLKL